MTPTPSHFSGALMDDSDFDPLDEDDSREWCDCDCHNYWHPDGLLCNDGYCDVCSAEAGGYPDDPHPADYDANEGEL